jgi:SAM-dependent methyltransferase
MTIHPCGCARNVEPLTGAIFRVRHCSAHQPSFHGPRYLTSDHYERLVQLDLPGHAASTDHLAGLLAALGSLPRAGANPRCLDAGCGASPYVGALRLAGWNYVGLDIQQAASRWNGAYWRAHSLTGDLLQFGSPWTYGLVFAAQSLEYMHDAHAALSRMAELLDHGCPLILAVTANQDPASNADQEWFYSEESLGNIVKQHGFAVDNLVRREELIYLKGRR